MAVAGDMVWVRVLEEGVFRFDASEAARAATGPSLSFADPRRREVPREGSDAPAVLPTCEVLGAVQKVVLKLPRGTSFYGTGEASGPLERTGRRVLTWNTDAWAYGPGTTSLYQSHPWVLAVLPDGKALGVLADTTLACEIDLRQESTIKFSGSSSYPVITFGPLNTPAEVITSLSHAIGTVSMPPKWSLGYHQCRYSYMSSEEVLKGLSGQPFSGPDIGGFAGNATPKLFGRWMGIGALFPFSRGHTITGSNAHEPWSFGKECEEVCRLALLRRYRLLPHIYTLFYHAHTKGIPVATPVFFCDPQDIDLRKVESSFLLGPLLVCASTLPNKGAHEFEHKLPKGIWLPFDFLDSHPDLPVLYLQGGGILPVGLPIQHVGEASLEDDMLLIIALDENGKAEGVLFEDAGDGYAFKEGDYLLTYYIAELHSSVVTVKVLKSQGSWKRPKRNLKINILLGGGAMISTDGVDGEEIHLTMPSESEVSRLIATSELEHKKRFGMIQAIPDIDEPSV